MNTGKKMTTNGKFIYGFVRAEKNRNLDLVGIDQGEVFLFPYRDIAVVAGDMEFKQFSALPKELLLQNLAIYQAVIERLMKNRHIIPVKYGTIVNEKDLKNILVTAHDPIKQHLKEMEGKIELNVAAVWSDFESILKEIGEEDAVRKLKEAAASKPDDKVFEVKLTVGKLVKASLDKRKKECASLIEDTLKKDTENHISHGIMDDSMIANGAFLINKDRQEAFEKRVDDLDRHYQDKINFRIVGPLPPYSFRTLEITKVDFGEISHAKEIMGLGEQSTAAEIKEVYWDLSKKFHPDKFPDDPEAQKRFENITKAYQKLTNYCRKDSCSFKEADIINWISVESVEQAAAM